MSTSQLCRYSLAAGAAFVGIGMLIEGIVVTGVLCLATALLLLPMLYRVLYIDSNEVQLLSPLIFVVISLFSFVMYTGVPEAHTVPLTVVYSTSVSDVSTITTMPSSADATHTTAVTVTTRETQSIVYRTPSGKRYHYNAECGGENSYEISFEDALSSGLTPCKKCAGG